MRAWLRAGRDWLTSPMGSLLAVRTRAPLFALTFDDGPDAEQTPAVLAALARAGARATFFMLVNRARRDPDLVAEVVSRGHEVALHGLTHRRLTAGSTIQALAEIAQARQVLTALVDHPIRFFRPPYGAQTPGIWHGVRRSGLEVVLWGASLWDWKAVSSAERTSHALTGIRPGAIVLAHDGLAGPADGADETPLPDLDRAAWAAEMLGRYQKDFGLGSVTLSELLDTGRPVRGARFVR